MHVSLAKMNASSWRKAADLVAQGTQANQQVRAAATADSSQLESFPLRTLSANDSSPPCPPICLCWLLVRKEKKFLSAVTVCLYSVSHVVHPQ